MTFCDKLVLSLFYPGAFLHVFYDCITVSSSFGSLGSLQLVSIDMTPFLNVKKHKRTNVKSLSGQPAIFSSPMTSDFQTNNFRSLKFRNLLSIIPTQPILIFFWLIFTCSFSLRRFFRIVSHNISPPLSNHHPVQLAQLVEYRLDYSACGKFHVGNPG